MPPDELHAAHGNWQDRLLHRPVCDLLGCRLPLVLAGMDGMDGMGGVGGVACAELAAAVAQAGGFGFLGMVREPVALIREEVAQLRAAGVARFGVNLIPSATEPALLAAQVDACIDLRAPVLGLFWDVVPELIRRVVDAGMLVVQQVGSVDDAHRAEAAGAGVLVVQGVEAGGHVRAVQPLVQLLPEVLASARVPVLAAGGVSDGADVATLLALGAQGAVLGTALIATHESFAHAHHKRRVVEADAWQGVGRVDAVVGAGEQLRRIAAEAAQMLRTAADEPPPIELSSPVCYAREFELTRDDAIDRASLAAELDALLEGARAAVRLTLSDCASVEGAGDVQSQLATLRRDEVKWCGMLMAALQSMGAEASTRTSPFLAEAASITDPGERLAALLRRRQGDATQRLRALLPQVVDERLSDGLAEMLRAYQRG
ncbi:MAG: nitronate monooxygenase [Proteobacteria bacterium]|nr:nitronate monooxygenase [Pseudomonadota bacterium]